MVEKYSKTAEASSLGPHERHFVDALLKDFRRGGLALSKEDQAEVGFNLADNVWSVAD